MQPTNRDIARPISFISLNTVRAILFSLAAIAFGPTAAMAQQATLTDDSQTSSNNPNQNFGSKVTFQVSGATLRGFVKFKLTPNLPTGTTGSQIEKATLKLFVTAVNTAGTIDVYRVAGAWDEGSITNNTAPALGALLTSVSLDATSEDRWVTVDITPLVKDWLNNVLPNNGVALVAAPAGVNATFNTKENGTTSHEPLLDVLLSHVATADHAATADSATTAATAGLANALSASATINGNQVNGPLTNATIAASSLTGVVPIAGGGTGSTTQNFVDLSTNQTIGGNKTFTSALNTATHYSIGGFRILHNGGGSNLYAGIAAGENNTTGGSNNFFGSNAGQANTTGSGNSFFGTGAGQANSSGGNNAFFGSFAGQTNTTGSLNAFFGQNAGRQNTTGGNNAFFGGGVGQANSTGNGNAFFGSLAGLFNTTGSGNSFFGTSAAFNNTEGGGNSFFGIQAGFNNTTGNFNTFVGQSAGGSNTVENSNTFIGAQANGAPGISNATAIGANASVATSNTMVLGTNVVTVEVPGNLNVNGTFTAALPAGSVNYIQNTTTQQAAGNFNISGDGTIAGTLAANTVNAVEYQIGGEHVMSNAGASNMFVGAATGAANTSGSGNSFFGAFAGSANTTGDGNSFFGNLAGRFNTSGSTNSFFGWTSGLANTTGSANSFFGFNTGNANTTGGENAFFGNRTGEANTNGAQNSFFGSAAGKSNISGSSNSFFGQSAGQANTTGNSNAFFGDSAGAANTTARFNSAFGAAAGFANSTGEHNSFFGFQAGRVSTGDNNSFFGSGAGQNNSSGNFNAFFGGITGVNNTTGSGNTFYGQGAGAPNTTGNANTFVGQNAGSSNTTESNNTFIGYQANGAPGITNATAVGANALVAQSDTMVLGTNAVTVEVPGHLNVTNSFSTGGHQVIGGNVFVRNGFPQVNLQDGSGSDLATFNSTTGPGSTATIGSVPGTSFVIRSGGLDSIFIDPNNQRVGIGTTSPTKKLDVNSGVNEGIQISGIDATELRIANTRVGDLNSPSRVVLQDNNSANQWSIENINNAQDFRIFEFPELVTPFFIKRTTGNVGIGTTTPNHKLDVGGDGNFSDTLQIGSHLNVGGNVFVRNSFPQVNLLDGAGNDLATFDATTGPGSTAAIGSVPGTSFVIRSGGLDSIFIDPNNQRVGVGTTSPSERLEVAGNLRINGDFVATGTKSAVVKLPDNREVALYAVESPGNWFEDFGSATLVNGVVGVQLDPVFAQTVNTEITYHVFLTANGNCRGLYVARKTATGFEVRELDGGVSNIVFDYRVVARRRGYESVVSRPR